MSEEESTGGAVLVYTERADVDMGFEEGVEACYWGEGWIVARTNIPNGRSSK